jgi:hypothetical protein
VFIERYELSLYASLLLLLVLKVLNVTLDIIKTVVV